MRRFNYKFYLIIMIIAAFSVSCASKEPPHPMLEPQNLEAKQEEAPADTNIVTAAAPKAQEAKPAVKEAENPDDEENVDDILSKKDAWLKPANEDDKYIVLNFEDADLQVVMQTISELIGMNYILGPQVKGKITIQTYKKIPRDELPDVLNAVLAVNGFATVKYGHYVKIIPAPEAKQNPIDTIIGRGTELKPSDVMVTQIFPLQNISANDLSNIIKPLVSKDGNIITHKETNLLIINELASNLSRLHKIIDLVDVPMSATTGEKIFVYYVKNTDASKLQTTLTSIFKEKQAAEKKPAITSAAAAAVQGAKKALKKKEPAVAAPESASVESELEGEMNIVADTETNALIIKTSPRDYKILLDLLDKLDITPRQVLIEVMIANINLDNSTSYGLEWTSLDQGTSRGKSFDILSGSTGNKKIDLPTAAPTGFSASGLSLLVSQTNQLKALINIQATKGNLNILSTPHILTANNKEASINIVDQEPIKKVSYTGTTTGQSVESYEYKDAGIKLTVTPKINDKGLVALKLTLEVSEVKDTLTDGTPSFTKRDVKTELVVQDNQTLIIGGLIKEKHQLSRTGIPWFMDIPYLGILFGSTTDKVNKTELVMMITPRVVSSTIEASELSKQYEEDLKVMHEKLKKELQ